MYKTRHIRTAVQHVIQQIDFKHLYALYLDIDGTLAEFQLDPENSFIPSTTLANLQALRKLNLPVIIVTGRDLQAARRLVPLNVRTYCRALILHNYIACNKSSLH